ncbi:hypothetical protein KQI68_07450 [Peptoniphilus sp. MSJ-1]|uniref:Uncharacterized protein n=1 Tax=Peptoniphilus ovalis TaxID=2841503 RepID=A0ABS6FKE5_9FIRM|nr:hypothetical protein [Peptoniphilus ovalis]MBU5669675.1 hypothetical protein [Peptoniphilus ovalis]
MCLFILLFLVFAGLGLAKHFIFGAVAFLILLIYITIQAIKEGNQKEKEADELRREQLEYYKNKNKEN